MRGKAFVIVSAVLVAVLACDKTEAVPEAPAGPAPDSFRVAFVTSRGDFEVQVNRDWAPHGADRLYQLVSEHFFDDERFFRVLPQYIAQFGLSDNKKANERWKGRAIPDDSLRHTNAKGTLAFASEGRDTRSHQLFFNIKDNAPLDKQGFVPVARVTQGLAVLDSLYSGYGDAPNQTGIRARGNSYLARFSKLDYIKTARIVP